MLVGERLRRMRTDRHWTQTDAAMACGVNQATICRAEQGNGIGPMAIRLIEMQLDKIEHDNPLPVVGRGEPPTGSAKEEAAMPRGVSNIGTRGKRTQTQRAQSGGKNYQAQAGLPATAHKQLNAFGKKLGTLQTGFQTLMTNIGGSGSGSTQAGGRGRSTRNQQGSQNI